jgi:hypothetical protein
MADVNSGDPDVWSNGQDGFIPNRAWDMVTDGTGLTAAAVYCRAELTRLNEYPGGDWTQWNPMKARLIFAHDQTGLTILRYRASRASEDGAFSAFTPHDDADRAWIDWVEVDVPEGDGVIRTEVRTPEGWTNEGQGTASPCPDNCTPGRSLFHVAQLLWRTDTTGLQVDSVAEAGFTVSDHLAAAGHYDDDALRRYLDATRRPNTFLVLLGQNMTSDEAGDIPGIWRAHLESVLDRYREAVLSLDSDAEPLFVLVSPWSTSDTSPRFRAITDVLAELALTQDDVGFINLHLLAGSHRHTDGTILADSIHCGDDASADSMAALLWSQIERTNAGLVDHVVEGNGVDLSALTLDGSTNLHIASGHHNGPLFLDGTVTDVRGWDIDTCGIAGPDASATLQALGGTDLDIRRLSLLPGGGSADPDGALAGAVIHAHASTARLTDVDVLGGSVDLGGAIALRQASIELKRCHVHDGDATLRGGLIDSVDSSMTAMDCTFENGTAQMGAGLSLDGGLNVLDTLTIRSCVATQGGGIMLLNGTTQLLDCRVTGNTADTGGGIRIHATAVADLQDTIVCGNLQDDIDGTWSDGGGNLVGGDCACPGDLNGDGVTSVDDLLIILEHFDTDHIDGDADGDGDTDVDDLLLVIQSWGPC